MSAEGKIELALGWDGETVTRTDIRSTRLLSATQLLAGLPLDRARARIGILFSVCGRAQTIAFAAAAQAAGGPAAPQAAPAAEWLLALEGVQEYLWRLVLDWPRVMDEAADATAFAALRRDLAGAALDEAAQRLAGFAADRIYGQAPEDWLCRIADEGLAGWLRAARTQPARLLARVCAEDVGAGAARCLPWLDAAALAGKLACALTDHAEFCAAPRWRGRPAETGALARTAQLAALHDMLQTRGASAAVRLLARLADLALWLERLRRLAQGERCDAWVRAAACGPGEGIAAVETARGTLVHQVLIEGERLVRCRIVAPTEWNFHPQGAYARAMTGVRATGRAQLERAASLMAHALDPCVAYMVRVDTHA